MLMIQIVLFERAKRVSWQWMCVVLSTIDQLVPQKIA